MKKYACVLAVIALVVALILPSDALAEAVGRITQVEGRVDLLKGGELPAVPVAVDAQVSTGDVLRTKSLSRAQITFIDNSVVTIAPESRLAVEDYQFQTASGKRNAVLQLFQGLAHIVVSKLSKVQEPDFIIKTHTAVMGVRGTEVGIRLNPNSSTFLTFQGITQVANIFPEVGDSMFKKADKIAFSFGRASVTLRDMEGTEVFRGLPPTLPFPVSAEDRKMFMHQMAVPVMKGEQTAGERSSRPSSSGSGLFSLEGLDSQSIMGSLASEIAPISGLSLTGSLINNVIIPPPLTAPNSNTGPTPVAPTTFTFSETYTGPYRLASAGDRTVGIFTNTGPGLGTRIGVYAGNFTANYRFAAVWNDTNMRWNSRFLGNFAATMTGKLHGVQGGILRGTMTMNLVDPVAGNFTLNGRVRIDPNGALTFRFNGIGIDINNKTITVPKGVWRQTQITIPAHTNRKI
jgi:hypothetical protein